MFDHHTKVSSCETMGKPILFIHDAGNPLRPFPSTHPTGSYHGSEITKVPDCLLFSVDPTSASTSLVEKASDQVQHILSLHDVCQLSFGVQIFDPKHKFLRITCDDCGDWPYERHDIAKCFRSHSAEIAL